MRSLSPHRYEALAGYARRLFVRPTAELEAYASDDETILGLIVQDIEDEDFGIVVFGRDAVGRFRAVEADTSLPSLDIARSLLGSALTKATGQPAQEMYQDDEPRMATDLLRPVVPEERFHSSFRQLITSREFAAARGLIAALSPYFEDIDGNFVEQFQTTAFDARLWELYLFAAFHELGFVFDRTQPVPDLHAFSYGGEVFVEAVTVNASPEGLLGGFPAPERGTPEFLAQYMPIKWGGPLFTKLERRYWELPHVAGRPLVFAIGDFHAEQSMLSTGSALATYLYGYRHIPTRDTEGHLVITPERIGEHVYGTKRIKSGFFDQPGAEHISAVIHNAQGTLPKFNRQGVMAGFGDPDVLMLRVGKAHVHDADASEPETFRRDVRDPEYDEMWVEGMSMYHNPRALVPIDPELFPFVAHHRLLASGIIESDMPEFFPYWSITQVIILQPGEDAEESHSA